MEDVLTTEETENVSTSEVSEGMSYDGEAWKDRNQTTYTSILDLYGASDLFSSETTELYSVLQQKDNSEYQELVNYVFSGQINIEDKDEEIINRIFSEEIKISKVKDYNKEENNYFICFILAEFFVVLVFISAMIKFNARKRSRREKYATEIDIEDL